MEKKNKERIKQVRDGYRKKNKDRIVEVTKKYKENNQESVKTYNKGYSQRPEVIERENNRKQLKRDNDPIFRLNNSLSFGVRNTLKNNRLSKNRKRWENLVGYNKETLKQHLEKQFKKGMTWDSYGEWHIDHIIPISFFKIKEVGDVEFRMCWRLENLQPLWKKDNICKNDKMIVNGKNTTSRTYERRM